MRRVRNYQSEKQWLFLDQEEKIVANGEYPAVLLRLLASRGYRDKEAIENYLCPVYETLSDPFLIPGMGEAVERISMAVKNSEKIAVYGDYDVDGVSATALLVSYLRLLGVEPVSYIPSRMNEGYGLNKEALDQLKKLGVQLVITVDSGSTSLAEIEYSKKIGIDIVVTDHHSLREADNKIVLPEAVAVVSPKRLLLEHPLYELAGVGVAFYLARALSLRFTDKIAAGQEKWLLDLVALGTICDIVPLTGENRILAHFGLKVLRKTRREGLRALFAVSEVAPEFVDSYKVGFLLGPRLNAAGRLEHAKTALELLLTADSERAAELAHNLNQQNLERQELTERIVAEAKAIVDADGNKKSIYLLSGKEWPAGVVGIVASRLVEEYGKPMLVMEDMGNELKGSARSISALNIIDALTDGGELLSHFGGHAYAAGFQLDKDRFLLLEERLIKYTDQKVSEVNLAPVIEIDQKIRVSEIDCELIELLEKLQPFGRDNKKPVFAIMGATIRDMRLVGNPSVHLKLSVSQKDQEISGIAFGFGESVDLDVTKEYDLAVSLEINEWNQRKKVEFRLIDIRESNKKA